MNININNNNNDKNINKNTISDKDNLNINNINKNDDSIKINNYIDSKSLETEIQTNNKKEELKEINKDNKRILFNEIFEEDELENNIDKLYIKDGRFVKNTLNELENKVMSLNNEVLKMDDNTITNLADKINRTKYFFENGGIIQIYKNILDLKHTICTSVKMKDVFDMTKKYDEYKRELLDINKFIFENKKYKDSLKINLSDTKNNINNIINTENKDIINGKNNIKNKDNNNSNKNDINLNVKINNSLFKEDSKEKEINDDMYTEINNIDITSKKINLTFDNINKNVEPNKNTDETEIVKNLFEINKLNNQCNNENLKITEDYYKEVDKIREEIYNRDSKLYSKLKNEEVSIILYSQIKKMLEKIIDGLKKKSIHHTSLLKEKVFLTDKLDKICKLRINDSKKRLENCQKYSMKISKLFDENEKLIKNNCLLNESEFLKKEFNSYIEYENKDIDFIEKGEKYEKKSKNKETINFSEMKSNIDRNNFYRNQLNKELNELIEYDKKQIINNKNKINYMIR